MRIKALTSHAIFGGAEETVYVGTRVSAVAFGALALVQLATIPGAVGWGLASASILFAVVSVACARRLASAGPATLHRLVWIVCAIPLINSVLFIVASGDMTPTMIMLSIVGIGAVATQARAMLLLSVMGVAAWAAVVVAGGPHPEGMIIRHSVDLALASAIAFGVFGIRARTGERLRRTELRLTERLAELDEARRQLEEASTTDQLTGCFNRRGWEERVEALHRLARREGASLTLGIVDLDEFKAFNDTLGHQAGDELLSSFARRASAVLRDVDVLARWGGDEFTVALYGCTLDEARTIFERIGEAAEGSTTCSIGFVQLHADETTEEGLRRADYALYRAKRGGRDQVASCVCERGVAACQEDHPQTAGLSQASSASTSTS